MPEGEDYVGEDGAEEEGEGAEGVYADEAGADRDYQFGFKERRAMQAGEIADD